VISDAADTVEALDRLRQHDATVGVVLRVDSPGGAVAPSQEMYDAVWRLRARKPVVASLGNVAASGGYYVASAADVVVADPGTLTGSIGAIMEVHNVASLAEKLGVSETVVKSGRFKDVGQPLRPMTEEERVLLQRMVDDVLGQFVDAVARGRGMEAGRVRALADGRLYSGAQAREVGLVDELGGRIEIRGFGGFVVRHRQAREGRNPRTGALVDVHAKRVPFFKVGKELRLRVDGKPWTPADSDEP